MLAIGKTVILLMLELITEYLFGTLLAKTFLKKEVNVAFSVLLGFIAYQALFQPITLIVTFSTGILHHLTTIWMGVLIGTIVISFVICKDIVKRQLTNSVVFIRTHKSVFLLAVIVVVAFCYYVSINGERNEDARYYIALMTTSVDTDTMFKHNVYNGYKVGALYLRRVLATFEMHSAVLSQLFQIHPLLIARIFRACQNVILTSGAVYLCGKTIFWKADRQAAEKSLMGVVVFWFMQLPLANTIYTPSTFVLYRAYEAKAFTAHFVVLFGLYLCVNVLRERNYRMLLLLVVFVWGSMALSFSAMLVAGIECAVLLLPIWGMRWIKNRKRER